MFSVSYNKGPDHYTLTKTVLIITHSRSGTYQFALSCSLSLLQSVVVLCSRTGGSRVLVTVKLSGYNWWHTYHKPLHLCPQQDARLLEHKQYILQVQKVLFTPPHRGALNLALLQDFSSTWPSYNGNWCLVSRRKMAGVSPPGPNFQIYCMSTACLLHVLCVL